MLWDSLYKDMTRIKGHLLLYPSGGLYIQYADGNFHNIDPVPGPIVINCCKFLNSNVRL
jgi:hypothetical protein